MSLTVPLMTAKLSSTGNGSTKSRDSMGCDDEHILENESFKPLSAEDIPESDYLVFA